MSQNQASLYAKNYDFFMSVMLQIRGNSTTALNSNLFTSNMQKGETCEMTHILT